MNGRVQCAGCGVWHFPALKWWHDRNCVVAVAPVVVHADKPVVVHKSRHGVHRNTPERKKYRREWMARDRKNRAKTSAGLAP